MEHCGLSPYVALGHHDDAPERIVRFETLASASENQARPATTDCVAGTMSSASADNVQAVKQRSIVADPARGNGGNLPLPRRYLGHDVPLPAGYLPGVV